MVSRVEQHNPVISGLRRVAVIAVIVSLSITALIGIYALLSGQWDSIQGKIMITTLVFAAFSVIVLIHLSAYTNLVKVTMFLAIVVGAIALAVSIFMIWFSLSWSEETAWFWDLINKVLVLSWIWSAGLTQLNLILLLRFRTNQIIRIVLWIAVTLIIALLILVTTLVITDGDWFNDTLGRIMGAMLILIVLASITLPILAKLAPDVPAEIQTIPNLVLSAKLQQELQLKASQAGLSVEEYLTKLLAQQQ